MIALSGAVLSYAQSIDCLLHYDIILFQSEKPSEPEQKPEDEEKDEGEAGDGDGDDKGEDEGAED